MHRSHDSVHCFKNVFPLCDKKVGGRGHLTKQCQRNRLPNPHRRWNDFQDEHDELLEQVERFRAAIKLSSSSPPTTAASTDPTVARGAYSKSDDPILTSPGQNAVDERDLEARNDGGGDLQGGWRDQDGGQRAVQPLSGLDASRIGSPESPRENTLQSNGGLGREIAGVRGQDAEQVDATSNPRRPIPLRPSSQSSRSPSHTPTPEAEQTGSRSFVRGSSRSGGRENEDEASWNRDVYRGDVDDGVTGEEQGEGLVLPEIAGSGAANRGGSSGSGRGTRGSFSKDSTTSVEAAGNTATHPLLQGGDSGGYYDDDFDDFLEEEEDEERADNVDRRNDPWQEIVAVRKEPLSGGSATSGRGGLRGVSNTRPNNLNDCNELEKRRTSSGRSAGGGDDHLSAVDAIVRAQNVAASPRGGTADREKRWRTPGDVGGDGAGDDAKPLAEVVYRPPSGSSRGVGKGERPKSAARQGRSASLNG